MGWLSELGRRLLMLVGRKQFDHNLEEEMRLHLEMREKDHIQSGLSPDEAHYAARRQFGNEMLLREVARDMWGWNSIETLIQDVRYGLRMLRKNPGFTAVAVTTLALGIGANTAIFSLVDAVLIRPLPYKNPDRLVTVREIPPGGGQFAVAPANFIDWQAESKSLDLAAYKAIPLNLTGTGEPTRLRGARVSASLLSILGVQPALGRTFLREEDREGNQYTALVSYGLWKGRFNGDPHLLGAAVTLDYERFTVVGVMPPGFDFPEKSEVWVPMAFRSFERASRGGHFIHVIGRLVGGVTLKQSRSEMNTVAERLAQQYSSTNKNWGVGVTPLLDDFLGNIRVALWVLTGAVGFVLLIACANVANLQLARGTARSKELAIRGALGGGRRRVVRQLLTESLTLAFIGGVMGLVVAWSSIHLVAAISPGDIPRLNEVEINSRALLFNLGVMLLAGAIFGLAPALRFSKTDLNELLKGGGRTTHADLRSGTRNAFVLLQVTLALVLLIGAGLLIRSFLRLQGVELGFNPDQVLTMSISLPDVKYGEPQRRAAFFQSVLDRVSSLHGVRKAAAVTSPPFTASWFFSVYLEGRTAPGQGFGMDYYAISSGYLQTMGIPLLKGRYFTERDNERAAPVAIINETAAHKLFPSEDPIGKRILTSHGDTVLREVVGVAADTKQHGLDTTTTRQVYEPYLQKPFLDMTLTILTSVDPLSLGNTVRGEVLSVDKDQAVADIQTMREIVSRSIGDRRFSMVLMAIFASLSLILATIGIYGLIAYTVAQRTHEIGVRIALGAKRSDVVKLVMRQGTALVFAGITLGLVGAWALTRFVASMLYTLKPTDPVTFAAVAAVLATVALSACYFPARRATKVDPMVALRCE